MDDMDGAFSKEYSSREQQFAIMNMLKVCPYLQQVGTVVDGMRSVAIMEYVRCV